MNLEAKLEEYRQIQTDIRQLYERRDRTFYLAFFVFIGVVSVGIRFENWILFFLTSIILLFLCFREILRQIVIQRYNTYILVNIEKHILGLERASIGEFIQDSKYPLVIPYLSIPFLVVTCLILGIYYFFKSFNLIKPYSFYLAIVIIIMSYGILISGHSFGNPVY